MFQVNAPAKKKPLAEQAVPRPFSKSGLKADEQIEQLVLMAERAGLLIAAEFLRDVWEAAQVPTDSPG